MARPVISRIPFAPLGALIVMVARNGGVQLRQLHHLLGMMARYVALEPLRLLERLCFDHRIAAHQLSQDPIFILGHWRSGTSHLQTLLSQDPSLATSTLYRSIFADIYCVSESWLKPVLNGIARVLGLPFSLQRLPLNLDIPAEGDVALSCLLSPHSYTWGHLFPRRLEEWMSRCVLEPSPEAAQGWLEHYDTVIRKLSMASSGRQIVMKSPGDTARVSLLLRQYPGAKFIYIHRDPVAVFHSNTYFWSVIHDEFALHKLSDDAVKEGVLSTYSGLLSGYLEQRDQVPAQQLVELRYEALRRDPVAALSQVYTGLGRGDLPDSIREFLLQQAEYPGHPHQPDLPLEAQIRDRWAFSFQAWPPEQDAPETVDADRPQGSVRLDKRTNAQTHTGVQDEEGNPTAG